MDESPTSATCVAVTFVGAGASCSPGSQVECNPGLYCDLSSQQCAPPGGVGASCDEGPGCASPLICGNANATPATCQPVGAAGAPCTNDGDCAFGLTCPFSTSVSVCTQITWVGANQPCSDSVLCMVGLCNSGGNVSGTCPTIIPDGQPCDAGDPSSTCDVFAQCAYAVGTGTGTTGTCLFGYPSCQ